MAAMPMSKFDEQVEEFFKHYRDRGMKKWAGFFLSDHTSSIAGQRARESVVYQPKPELSAAENSSLLLKAYENNYQVRVQVKKVDAEGHFLPDIVAFVVGISEDGILLGSQLVHLDEINHVEILAD